ncbi:MAG: response regulator transcription factor [Myxococcales bacterium]|jgi:DNA-binding response OmpR family regulator|nr:response regulator transcription factor [Myxococcales bacterium]
MRILLVEDSDSILRMIEALVTARGYEVVGVGTGAKGLEEAFARTPDLVLLDVNLPGAFDGIEVCRRLRAEPTTRDVPIIIISAMSTDDAKRAAQEAGATAYYTKPFSPISLLKEIDSIRRRSGTTPVA